MLKWIKTTQKKSLKEEGVKQEWKINTRTDRGALLSTQMNSSSNEGPGWKEAQERNNQKTKDCKQTPKEAPKRKAAVQVLKSTEPERRTAQQTKA